MTAGALIEAPRRLGRRDEGGTLDDLLVSLWEGIGGHRTMECPVCGGEMKPAYGAHARAIGGKCGACGSVLQ